MNKPETKESIIVVDDHATNLKLLDNMLSRQGYRVRTFTQGQLAISAAEQEPPDLFLLDIMMPDMNGYEVCKRLKSIQKLSLIPVIFLSALTDADDKVKAFRAGAVDYITKPFKFEEVQARVETHLTLQRAYRAERELLEQTLNGAIRTLADLVQLTGLVLSTRSESIRGIVDRIATRLAVEERWQYELAAILCLIGCISLPGDAFERAYAGERVSPEEARMFREHPENGARLLANIPRLESVAEMIRRQQTVSAANPASATERGAWMLRLAIELDRRVLKGVDFGAALTELRSSSPAFPPEMLGALEGYTPAGLAFEIKRLLVPQLRASMILEDDLLTKDGSCLILQKGTTLNLPLLERIRNFAVTRGVREPIRTRVAGLEGAPWA